jgi:hypothetical protein
VLIAGVPPDRILNFMPPDELLGWAQSVREKQIVGARAAFVTSFVPKTQEYPTT